MTLVPVESKLLSHYAYDPTSQILRVVFRSKGNHGEYMDVTPEEFKAFESSLSKGSHLLQVIKPAHSYRAAEV